LRAENKGNKVRTGDTAVVKHSAGTDGARKYTLDGGSVAPPWMVVWSTCNGRRLWALRQFPKCRLPGQLRPNVSSTLPGTGTCPLKPIGR